MLKPSWMTRDEYREYKRTYPIFRCSHPGCDETDPNEETIDHIKAKVNGGTNDLSNLEPKCRRHNSMKGAKDDAYWSQNLYFDYPIALEALRTSQRQECFERILGHADWFSRPFSQISRVLYTLAWVVGSGKTLAIPTLGFGLNYLIRRERGIATPRVNRILVLSKEQAIRDQVAEDLRKEINGYGICPVAPRVGVVTSSGFLNQPQLIDQFDIWTSCVNMFFENNVPIEHLEGVLAMFPLIVVDEPHYAVDQVLRIVQSAYKSLCFGLTGTPIKANGLQLKKFVLLSLYDYHSANEFDQSMKYLPSPDHKQEWRDAVQILDIESAELQQAGESVKTKSTEDADYSKNCIPALSVAQAVVQYVHECDETYDEAFSLIRHEAAPHRHAIEHTADLVYPVHGLIQVETIHIGYSIRDSLNSMFEADRHKYPADRGYRAELVHSDVIGRDEDGNTLTDKGIKLKADHPWMQAKRNKGELTLTSSRFLIVVGMGREGVNNPLCGVVGVACSVGSIIDVVQRAFGRQLRAFVSRNGNVLRVPPRRLDTIKVISHSTFDNHKIFVSAARYLLDMPGSLKDLPTMSDLIEGSHAPEELSGTDPDSILTTRDKFSIGGQIGIELLSGKAPEEIDIRRIADTFGPSEARKKKAEEWGQKTLENPKDAASLIGLKDSLQEVSRVLSEIIDIDPTDETLITFIKRVSPHLAESCRRLDEPLIRAFVIDKYKGHARQYQLPTITPRTNLEKIKNRIVHEVRAELGAHLQCEPQNLHKLVYKAMKMVLGVQDGESLRNGEKYDIPQNHVILTRPEIDRKMKGWVIRTLALKGHCPYIAAAFNIHQESEVAADAV